MHIIKPLPLGGADFLPALLDQSSERHVKDQVFNHQLTVSGAATTNAVTVGYIPPAHDLVNFD